MNRALAILMVFAWLLLLGCIAFAGAPQLRTVLPPVAAPKTVTVTTTIPAVIYVAPDLREPFSPLTGWSTNRAVPPAVAATMFFSAIATNFPLTNQPIVVKWSTVSGAIGYRIYLNDGEQLVETANKTQLTFKMWKVWPTNSVTMTAVNSNNVESLPSKRVTFQPELRLSITRN